MNRHVTNVPPQPFRPLESSRDGPPSWCPRNTDMSVCPAEERLAGLLADALSAAERDDLARHVEGCASCQERLARLTPDTEVWRRAEQPPGGSSAEEGVL